MVDNSVAGRRTGLACLAPAADANQSKHAGALVANLHSMRLNFVSRTMQVVPARSAVSTQGFVDTEMEVRRGTTWSLVRLATSRAHRVVEQL